MKKQIELFLLELQSKGYNIRWVQGLIRYQAGMEVIRMYDTQTDQTLGDITITEPIEGEIGDLVRSVKYPLLDPELLRKHIAGMIKVDPSYNKYAEMALEPTEEEDYEAQAQRIADEMGLTLEVKYVGWERYFPGDNEKRSVFRCKLIRAETEEENERSYSFRFGQSIAAGDQEPSLYDVLACLQKYCPGEDLQEFCDMFGYDIEDPVTEGIYESVLQEWEAMEDLFSENELEKLHEIQ